MELEECDFFKIVIRVVISFGFPLLCRHRFKIFTKRVLIIIIIIINMTDLSRLVMHCVLHILRIPIPVSFVTLENDVDLLFSPQRRSLCKYICNSVIIYFKTKQHDAEHQKLTMEIGITIIRCVMCALLTL